MTAAGAQEAAQATYATREPQPYPNCGRKKYEARVQIAEHGATLFDGCSACFRTGGNHG